MIVSVKFRCHLKEKSIFRIAVLQSLRRYIVLFFFNMAHRAENCSFSRGHFRPNLEGHDHLMWYDIYTRL
jgi:hypothetical protein